MKIPGQTPLGYYLYNPACCQTNINFIHRDILAENDYVKVHTIRLLGILLSIFSKKTHLTSIRNIETSYTRTGLKGFWVSANKNTEES